MLKSAFSCKMTFRVVLFLLLLWAVRLSWAQGYIYDSVAYHRVPVVAPLNRAALNQVPPRFSLRAYCPTPQNQGDRGDCVGWAVAYAARTILAARQKRWTGEEITRKAFSAAFLYDQVKPITDSNCMAGATLPAALKVLQEVGALPRYLYGDSCHRQPLRPDWLLMAESNRITNYQRLFDSDSPAKSIYIKRSLAAGKPVVVGIRCCSYSFLFPDKELWQPQANEIMEAGQPYGGHALTVVGYDDTRYGGAFEVMNSWGTSWGKGGFLWIRYEDMERICLEAFELSAELPTPLLQGELIAETTEGNPLRWSREAASGYSRFVAESETQHTKPLLLRVLLEAPAFFYVIGMVGKQAIPLFPAKGESDFLSYSAADLPVPMQVNGQRVGRYVILISHEALHLPSICQLISHKPSDDALQRLLQIISVPAEQLVYGTKIIFRQQSMEQKGVLAVSLVVSKEDE